MPSSSIILVFKEDSGINYLSYGLGSCQSDGNYQYKIKNLKGFPGGSDNKESTCNAGDLGLIPGWGRSPGKGNGNPLQYSCVENPMDGGAWWATVHRVAKSWTRLSNLTFNYSALLYN